MLHHQRLGVIRESTEDAGWRTRTRLGGYIQRKFRRMNSQETRIREPYPFRNLAVVQAQDPAIHATARTQTRSPQSEHFPGGNISSPGVLCPSSKHHNPPTRTPSPRQETTAKQAWHQHSRSHSPRKKRVYTTMTPIQEAETHSLHPPKRPSYPPAIPFQSYNVIKPSFPILPIPCFHIQNRFVVNAKSAAGP